MKYESQADLLFLVVILTVWCWDDKSWGETNLIFFYLWVSHIITSCRVVQSAAGKHRWNVMERLQRLQESGVASLIYHDISEITDKWKVQSRKKVWKFPYLPYWCYQYKYLSSTIVDPLACQAMVGSSVGPQLSGSEPCRGVDGWWLSGPSNPCRPCSGTSWGTTRPPPAWAARLQSGLPSVSRGTLNITLLALSLPPLA